MSTVHFKLNAAAETVVTMADYFGELKDRGSALAAAGSGGSRGYFSPAEEDEIRALQASYWQSRAALFDLISSLQGKATTGSHQYDREFLVAFAAALVLIDGARFLRESVRQRSFLRRKLNEPSTEFGIPGGVYDRVQQSLFSVRNAWHLYHAIHFFERFERRFRQSADTPAMVRVLAVIDRLIERADVSLATFAKSRLRTRGSIVARQLARGLVGRAIYGLQTLTGILMAEKYVRPGHHPALPADVASEIHGRLLPGDVLVVRKEYAITNYFLPGYWPHAAFYVGDAAELERFASSDEQRQRLRQARANSPADGSAELVDGPVDAPVNGLVDSPIDGQDDLSIDESRVVEAKWDGVRFRTLASPFAADSLVVLRPTFDSGHRMESVRRAFTHEGKPYDFDFDFRRSDRLVCTEVAYRSLDGVGPLRIPLQRRAGRMNLSGNDLIAMAIAGEHFRPIAAYAPNLSSGLADERSAVGVLRAAQR